MVDLIHTDNNNRKSIYNEKNSGIDISLSNDNDQSTNCNDSGGEDDNRGNIYDDKNDANDYSVYYDRIDNANHIIKKEYYNEGDI